MSILKKSDPYGDSGVELNYWVKEEILINVREKLFRVKYVPFLSKELSNIGKDPISDKSVFVYGHIEDFPLDNLPPFMEGWKLLGEYADQVAINDDFFKDTGAIIPDEQT